MRRLCVDSSVYLARFEKSVGISLCLDLCGSNEWSRAEDRKSQISESKKKSEEDEWKKKEEETHKTNQYLYVCMRNENETESDCESLNDPTTTFERIFMTIWPIQIWKSHGHTQNNSIEHTDKSVEKISHFLLEECFKFRSSSCRPTTTMTTTS